jgi:hypothetical protein
MDVSTEIGHTAPETPDNSLNMGIINIIKLLKIAGGIYNKCMKSFWEYLAVIKRKYYIFPYIFSVRTV